MDSFDSYMRKREETDKEIKTIIQSNLKELGRKERGEDYGNVQCRTCGKTKQKVDMIWHTYKELWNCKEHQKV